MVKRHIMVQKYTFSGHESFPCKSLWLKKGYDFVANKNDFNSPDAIITLAGHGSVVRCEHTSYQQTSEKHL